MSQLPQPLLLPRLHSPLTFGGEEPSPFSRGEHERHLRVIVDDARLSPSIARDVVLQLAGHELLDITTTTRAGPSTLSFDPAVVYEDHIPVTVERQEGVTRRAIWPASTWLHFAGEHVRQHGGDPSDVQMRYLLAGAADRHVDGLVLPDTGFAFDFAKRANPLIVTQGAALVGLFLRSRDAHVVEIPNCGRIRTDLGTQRFIVGRSLLHAGWRWWSACAAAGRAPGGEGTSRVAQGLQMRFERCIRARDEVMVQCLEGAQGRSTDRDVLYHMDAMLLWLGGVFDVTPTSPTMLMG